MASDTTDELTIPPFPGAAVEPKPFTLADLANVLRHPEVWPPGFERELSRRHTAPDVISGIISDWIDALLARRKD